MKEQDFEITVPGRGQFDVVVDRLAGLCSTGPTILIDRDLEGKDALDTAIHEYLHALHPDWKEKRVARTATAMTKYLWKLGVRIRKR